LCVAEIRQQYTGQKYGLKLRSQVEIVWVMFSGSLCTCVMKKHKCDTEFNDGQ